MRAKLLLGLVVVATLAASGFFTLNSVRDRSSREKAIAQASGDSAATLAPKIERATENPSSPGTRPLTPEESAALLIYLNSQLNQSNLPSSTPDSSTHPNDSSSGQVVVLTPISEPQARAALSLVGYDAGALTVWTQAINDHNLPPRARSNLIEDLNEDGFPNPRAVTQNDLPLIVNRLRIIEELAPDAMDDVNAAAFQEAYKDLQNMYNRLTRQ